MKFHATVNFDYFLHSHFHNYVTERTFMNFKTFPLTEKKIFVKNKLSAEENPFK